MKKIRLTKDGQTKTVKAWARELGLPISTIYRRLYAGKSDEEILAPVDKKIDKESAYELILGVIRNNDGEVSLRDIADATGIPATTVNVRVGEMVADGRLRKDTFTHRNTYTIP